MSKEVAIETAIELAADQIVNARDLCGNEREAAADTLADYGFRPTPLRIAQAMAIANGEWRSHQRAAGVTKPISPAERASINRKLETNA